MLGLRRSSSTTSRQRPWCRPIRSLVPTTRKPWRWCRRMLGTFSGKMPDWIVQIPAASVESISARSRAAPTPLRRAVAATYTECSTTPAYAQRPDTGDAATARRNGVGAALLQALIDSTEAAEIWTIQSGIFPENIPSIRLHQRKGFRVVGTRERIGQHRGRWRDVVLVERRSASIGAI